jgi:hypothetical protein
LTKTVKLPMLAFMSGIERILAVANAYADAEGIELSTVSWRVFGDTKKLTALESGSDIWVGRYERALQWFSDNWPSSAKWPRGVPRPERERAAS